MPGKTGYVFQSPVPMPDRLLAINHLPSIEELWTQVGFTPNVCPMKISRRPFVVSKACFSPSFNTRRCD